MVRSRLARTIAAAMLVAFGVVLWGGYARDWTWTGFPGRADLWDWLHVLALPLALALVPLWLRHRGRPARRGWLVLAVVAAAFVVLVVLGYVYDLAWTGFPGNTLWDWLELLVLPLTIALVPVWLELAEGVRLRHAVVLACIVLALAVAVVGGYVGRWDWTGFRGNTLYDWIDLFVAPLLLPLVLVPLAAALMISGSRAPDAERAR